MDAEITSLSSRGQIVIPLHIRNKLHLHEGEKFVVVGEEDTIILKKLQVPSFDELLKKTRLATKNITAKNVEDAIRRTRTR